jgi:hypothetical protein
MKPKNRTKKETRNPKQGQKKRLNNAINVEIQTDDGALGLSNELYRYNTFTIECNNFYLKT